MCSSGSLPAIVDSCPNVQVVCNAKCKQTLELIYDTKKWKWLIISPKQPLKIGKVCVCMCVFTVYPTSQLAVFYNR